MKTITIKAANLDLNPRARYARDVIERGHIAGVLSGAELKGTAREFGGHYARQRKRAIDAVYKATNGQVRDDYVGRFGRRVWVDAATATPVQLAIED